MGASEEELAAWLRLHLTPGVGPRSARALLAAFGLPHNVLGQSDAALAPFLSAAQLRAVRNPPQELPAVLTATLRWLEQPGQRVLTLADAAYPSALFALEDPPLLLHVLGRSDAWPAPERCVSVVGSRNPTPQGVLNARQFARALSERHLCVVSGLALGIDGAAHEGALQGPGGTLAVVGTGLDRVYPKAHKALAHRVAEQGWLLSEFSLGTPALAANFPRRNRLIAALGCGTLVVEAALQSGSLITARQAAELGREVFAIPGSIHAPQSRGCHALIKQGAKLVESAQDVLEELRLDTAATAAPVAAQSTAPAQTPDALTSNALALLQALGHDPVNLDTLLARTALDAAQVQATLLNLELDGQVARLPGGLFQRMGSY